MPVTLPESAVTFAGIRNPQEMVLYRLKSLIEGMGLTQGAVDLLDETLEIDSAIDDDLGLLRSGIPTYSPATLTYSFLGH
jgi:hypothetical protein